MQTRPKRWGCGRANVTLHLLPCATRAGNASDIRSIPAIQGAPIMPIAAAIDSLFAWRTRTIALAVASPMGPYGSRLSLGIDTLLAVGDVACLVSSCLAVIQCFCPGIRFGTVGP